MDETARGALQEALLHLDPIRSLDSVWRRDPHHVDGMHPEALEAFRQAFEAATRSDGPSVQGLVILGQQGVGKTHFLGQVREAIEQTGFFVLVQLIDGRHFWTSVAQGFVLSLLRRDARGQSQLQAFLSEIGALLDWPSGMRGDLAAGRTIDLATLDEAVRGFRQDLRFRDVARNNHEALRALLLLASPNPSAQDAGDAWFQSLELGDDYLDWGLRSAPPPREVIRQLSAVLALVRPTVIAVDQIDTLLTGAAAVDDLDPASIVLLEQVAGGLMDLRDTVSRGFTLLSALTGTWNIVQRKVVPSAAQRFDDLDLFVITSPELARQLIEARLRPAYAQVGFTPPNALWPVGPEALEGARGKTPRALIRRVKHHVQDCLRRGEISLLGSLSEEGTPSSTVTAPAPSLPSAQLDRRYADLLRSVTVPPLGPDEEDQVVPKLLRSGLEALRHELGPTTSDAMSLDDEAGGGRAALHARLRQTLDEETERERLWSFRAIGQSHAGAVKSRLKGAVTRSGIEIANADRFLVLLRRVPWPAGPKTKELVDDIHRLKARTAALTETDVRVFLALEVMLEEAHPALRPWLVARRPASGTPLFRTVFTWAPPEGWTPPPATNGSPLEGPPLSDPPSQVAPEEGDASRVESLTPSATWSDEPRVLPLGQHVQTRVAVGVPLERLRKHVVVFAGSGSGKTVLLRRLVEEAALRGVSSIVLDPNNDLARLGDAWPEPPPQWGPGDAERAAFYLEQTEVVVWTPRRASGRPLTFQPLPDFASVRSDPEALALAIDTAVASLAPRVRMEGDTPKALQGRAVLTSALRHFAMSADTRLPRFIGLLAELPEDVSGLDRASALASEMAQTLEAQRTIDPLFGGEGEPVDPSVLLTPTLGKRARISVISFVGLPDDTQRQGFVNQLQMALFSWARRNPANDRPLSGLFVMDEAQNFAPSGKQTPCTESTLSLASQARKYGLGLVFATQAPKGLHNRIPGNATTQFFGKLGSQVQIDTARTYATSKGGRVDDIGSLGTGEFYAVSDGLGLQKVTSRLCLSHHPPSPLTEEEVLLRSRGVVGR